MINQPHSCSFPFPYQRKRDDALPTIQRFNSAIAVVVRDSDARLSWEGHRVHRHGVRDVVASVFDSVEDSDEIAAVAGDRRLVCKAQEDGATVDIPNAGDVLPGYRHLGAVVRVGGPPLAGEPREVIQETVPEDQKIKEFDSEFSVESLIVFGNGVGK
ncbi:MULTISPECIES: hypothetical protein [unclassified Frondihabitans]|uniref:hypothetical protein n=1 Tax=unclassified Frondihabitans TaxID=2626248 RepID=UPI000F4E28CD|nr:MULTISPECIES: hypothetical protein [unclassified Frondihabitans]